MSSSDKLSQLAQQQGLSSEQFEVLMAYYQQFSYLMCEQTLRNWHKGGRTVWLQADQERYLLEAQVNLEEFRIALAHGHDVDDKAVDVCNDIFYLWDAYRNAVGGVPTETMDKIRDSMNAGKQAIREHFGPLETSSDLRKEFERD